MLGQTVGRRGIPAALAVGAGDEAIDGLVARRLDAPLEVRAVDGDLQQDRAAHDPEATINARSEINQRLDGLRVVDARDLEAEE